MLIRQCIRPKSEKNSDEREKIYDKGYLQCKNFTCDICFVIHFFGGRTWELLSGRVVKNVVEFPKATLDGERQMSVKSEQEIRAKAREKFIPDILRI